MNRVIQPDSWSCLAACACMITGEPIQALYADVGHDGSAIVEKSQYADGRRGFSFCEITRYLAGQGVNLGAPAEAWNSTSYGMPALLIVQGATYNHAVIWNGTEIMDPSPYAGALKTLWGYQIKQWWPIVMITQEG